MCEIHLGQFARLWLLGITLIKLMITIWRSDFGASYMKFIQDFGVKKFHHYFPYDITPIIHFLFASKICLKYYCFSISHTVMEELMYNT